ncbi:MAG: hypothetical protein HYW89_03160 [Candidatus Sungiibacteriota bacterium]|uniref:Uncharacterized protein n=1 Tax=Candidatus Sungiibacteriota bacterium TaxID=2750080 RepID=A0A7T5RIW9_9BACT|nr:MAG: hypothetical protein HYW89_03160 [Candidatus Sungbacteria bacterium]
MPPEKELVCGEFDRVEYLENHTIFYFKEGQTFVFKGLISSSYVRGEILSVVGNPDNPRIVSNGMGCMIFGGGCI